MLSAGEKAVRGCRRRAHGRRRQRLTLRAAASEAPRLRVDADERVVAIFIEAVDAEEEDYAYEPGWLMPVHYALTAASSTAHYRLHASSSPLLLAYFGHSPTPLCSNFAASFIADITNIMAYCELFRRRHDALHCFRFGHRAGSKYIRVARAVFMMPIHAIRSMMIGAEVKSCFWLSRFTEFRLSRFQDKMPYAFCCRFRALALIAMAGVFKDMPIFERADCRRCPAYRRHHALSPLATATIDSRRFHLFHCHYFSR